MTNEQKNKMMNIINIIREIFFYLSKIIFLVMGIYYLMTNYIAGNIYKLALLDVLKIIPGIGHIISYFQFLDKLSLLLLIMPMAIVGTSLFIDNSKLKIISGFFSLGGVFLFLPYFSKLKNYEEGIRAGFLSIFNENNLQNKETYLRENLEKILLEKALTIDDPQSFIDFIKKTLENDLYFYLIPIKTMNQIELKEYTVKLSEKIIQNYNFFKENTINTIQTVQQPTSTEILPYLKVIAIVATSVIAVIGIIFIYQALKGESENLKKGADLIENGEIQNKKAIDTSTHLGEKEIDILKMAKSDYESVLNCIKGTEILTEEIAQLQVQMADLRKAQSPDLITNQNINQIINNIQNTIKRLAEIGQSQNCKQNENLKEMAINIQLMKDEIRSISMKGNVVYTENQFKEINQLTATAAENRIHLDAAQSVQAAYLQIQKLTDETMGELKQLKNAYEARISDLDSLTESLLKRQTRYESKVDHLDRTHGPLQNLFVKHEEQIQKLEGIVDEKVIPSNEIVSLVITNVKYTAFLSLMLENLLSFSSHEWLRIQFKEQKDELSDEMDANLFDKIASGKREKKEQID